MTGDGNWKEETYLPADDRLGVAKMHDFVLAHEAAGGGDIVPRHLLVGPDPDEQVEIPAEVYQVLLQIVEAMSQGVAVTVRPEARVLTTQQAAVCSA